VQDYLARAAAAGLAWPLPAELTDEALEQLLFPAPSNRPGARGTTVVGEIGHGLVQGQDRVFVLWDRAETPDHAVIELASPGTDELGRSGLPGHVNNHWWERFGGAILLSVIQGGLQTGTALAANSGSGGGTFFNSFQSNGTNVSDTALQATINIPPTLEKNQGDNMAIFVAKDLDFSDVYNHVTGTADGQ
jgi:type IV secretion system protein VirB10